mmetsp:Transcript_5903/g.9131  ORF Transcript_5903/g.9131 Transcript_5903/m.9131 type:complete len:91 (-) Transcript_5903:324-596(-)
MSDSSCATVSQPSATAMFREWIASTNNGRNGPSGIAIPIRNVLAVSRMFSFEALEGNEECSALGSTDVRCIDNFRRNSSAVKMANNIKEA